MTSEPFKLEPAARMRVLPDYVFGRLNAIKLKMRQEGRDVIDFGMGNPDSPTIDPIVRKMKVVLEDHKSHRYSAAKGIPHLRKAVAVHYADYYGVTIDPDTQVIATIGSKEGLSHLSLALLGPGDACLVPEPSFPVHIWSAVIAGAQVITFPISNDADTFISGLKAAIHNAVIRPKMVYLNFPHNPTALCVDLPFYEKVVDFCREENLFIVSDFAYKDITFDGYKAPSILQVNGAADIAVEFMTMSKSYNMAGWRIGFCVGNARAVALLGQIKGYYDYGLFTPIQVAAIEALKLPVSEVQAVALKYQKRRDILVEGLNRAGWPVEKNRGAMFMWARIPEPFRHLNAMDFSELLLQEAEVLVSPGSAFGKAGEGYVRMSLVENSERIRQGIKNVSRLFKRDGNQV
jgi:alanine-synthesizing transaminase